MWKKATGNGVVMGGAHLIQPKNHRGRKGKAAVGEAVETSRNPGQRRTMVNALWAVESMTRQRGCTCARPPGRLPAGGAPEGGRTLRLIWHRHRKDDAAALGREKPRRRGEGTDQAGALSAPHDTGHHARYLIRISRRCGKKPALNGAPRQAWDGPVLYP